MMTDDGQTQPPESNPGGAQYVFYILVAVLAAIIGFAVVAIAVHKARHAQDEFLPEPQQVEAPSGIAAGMSRLVRVSPPSPAPEITFEDGDGKPHTLSEWRGKVVLVNLWATWCPPCKAEMPSLDRLQAKLGGADFAVVAISLDRGGADAPRKFLASAGIGALGLFVDKSGQLLQTLKAPGLPLTVLIDAQGRQIARLAGPAEWDGAEAEAVIRAAIAAGR